MIENLTESPSIPSLTPTTPRHLLKKLSADTGGGGMISVSLLACSPSFSVLDGILILSRYRLPVYP